MQSKQATKYSMHQTHLLALQDSRIPCLTDSSLPQNLVTKSIGVWEAQL